MRARENLPQFDRSFHRGNPAVCSVNSPMNMLFFRAVRLALLLLTASNYGSAIIAVWPTRIAPRGELAMGEFTQGSPP
jgi:hypothetical protein